ncbi:NUDIX hydrolase [Rhizobium mesosinicum]|uniref:NUDIX hydrolase n=1 Tax=Rhizobium mesosinicum TaxID=335017 RepID=A0ABS7GN35_9HYPH|nr:NUDIX hydrolase [Rhizobium mesosinicum]MBW9051071.1 NUDIX hydrolase [Rhizobium mesosinicum]
MKFTLGDLLAKASRNRRPKFHQAAAICLRTSGSGTPEALLITSRETGRWIIPKGHIRKREQTFICAEREAYEEAGVQGKITRAPLGHYTYVKDREKLLSVAVHVLRVETEVYWFAERNERSKVWLHPKNAALMVEEPELKTLLRFLGTDTEQSPLPTTEQR